MQLRTVGIKNEGAVCVLMCMDANYLRGILLIGKSNQELSWASADYGQSVQQHEGHEKRVSPHPPLPARSHPGSFLPPGFNLIWSFGFFRAGGE